MTAFVTLCAMTAWSTHSQASDWDLQTGPYRMRAYTFPFVALARIESRGEGESWNLVDVQYLKGAPGADGATRTVVDVYMDPVPAVGQPLILVSEHPFGPTFDCFNQNCRIYPDLLAELGTTQVEPTEAAVDAAMAQDDLGTRIRALLRADELALDLTRWADRFSPVRTPDPWSSFFLDRVAEANPPEPVARKIGLQYATSAQDTDTAARAVKLMGAEDANALLRSEGVSEYGVQAALFHWRSQVDPDLILYYAGHEMGFVRFAMLAEALQVPRLRETPELARELFATPRDQPRGWNAEEAFAIACAHGPEKRAAIQSANLRGPDGTPLRCPPVHPSVLQH